MDQDSYLEQWKALKKDGGIEIASSRSTTLFVVGASLTVVVALLVYLQAHVALVALVSAAIGWVIAERNALKSRIALWPKLEKYLNWELINADSSK